MTTALDPATVMTIDEPADEVVAQFEPDFDGTWEANAPAPSTVPDAADDPQWIVWTDAARESAWIAHELLSACLAAVRLVGTRW